MLNKVKLGPKRWNGIWSCGLKHLLFALELYEIQIKQGGYILHEHPNSASSWHVPEVVDSMHKHSLYKMTGDMCRFGMTTTDNMGEAFAKQPTGFLSNSPFIRAALGLRCLRNHRHAPLTSGRAKAAQ